MRSQREQMMGEAPDTIVPELRHDVDRTSASVVEAPGSAADTDGDPFATQLPTPASGAPVDQFATGSFPAPISDSAFVHAPSASNGSNSNARSKFLGKSAFRSYPATAASIANDAARIGDGVEKYEIVREIASGGLGCVWLATDRKLAREVAVKDLLPQALQSPSLVQRFNLEAQITGQLEHPGIVPVYELSTKPDGAPFYAMKLLRGRSLHEAIQSLHSTVQRSAPNPAAFTDLLGAFVDVCNAMAYAHSKGVIHRDLKPHNVMLGEFGEALVVDWGLAKVINAADEIDDSSVRSQSAGSASNSSSRVRSSALSETSETQTGSAVGTPSYMSPEQASGELEKLDARSDIFALGTILYELLTGSPPYIEKNVLLNLDRASRGDYTSVRSRKPGVPRPLAAICEKAMAIDRDLRYASAKELGADVTRWLTGEAVTAFPEPWYDRCLRWIGKHRSACFAFAASTAMLLAAIGAWRWREAERIAELRRHANDLLMAGEEHAASGEGDAARHSLAQVLSATARNPALADLHKSASTLLSRVESKLAESERAASARRQLAQFAELHDDALFHFTYAAGDDVQKSLHQAEKSAQAALAIFGMDGDKSGPPQIDELNTSADEQARVRQSCRELLMALAEVALRIDSVKETSRAPMALGLLERAASLGGKTHAYFAARAACLELLDDIPSAQADRQRANATPPADSIDFFLIAKELYHKGQTAAALEYFDRVLRVDPAHFWAHYFVSVCQLKLERPEQAVASLTALLHRRPGFLWLHLLRGHAYAKLGDYATAETEFDAALKIDPNESAVFTNRAAARLEQGRVEDAIADLDYAIKLHPDGVIAHVGKAKALARKRRWNDALVCLDRAIRIAPRVPDAYRVRAAIRRDMNDAESAVQDYELAIRLGSDGTAAADDYFELGSALRELGQKEAALRALDEVIRRDEKHPQAHRIKADVLLSLQRPSEAIREMNLHLHDAVTDVETLRRRGLELAAMGDLGAALADFSNAVRTQPDASFTRGRRGWTLLNNAASIALEDFHRAIVAEPQNGDYYAGRGYALALSGRYEEAAADAERAVEKATRFNSSPQQISIRFNAACIYAQAFAQATFSSPSELRSRFVASAPNRCVELLRSAAELVPATSRPLYVAEVVVPEPSLQPVREREEFKSFVAAFDVR